MEHNLTLKQRWGAIIRLAWPLVIATSFWNLQLTVDRVFLGQYSTDALAAAMQVMPIFWSPMALLQQTAAYSMTFTAQYFGSEQKTKIGPAIWISLYISFIGGLLILLLIPASPFLFDWIGHPEHIRIMEDQYFQALLWSALPTAVVAGISGFYTGIDQTRMVMWINGVGLITNVLLDYLLVFGNLGFPELGIVGAGYATAGANLAAAVFAAVMVFSRENEAEFHIRSGFRWNGSLFFRFLRFGVPSGLQWALEGLAFTAFLIFVGRMENGDTALAASSIAVTIFMLAILPPMGIAQAVAAKVGQYLGEDQPEFAIKYVWSGVQVCLMFIVPVATTFLLFPGFYASWFENSNDPLRWQAVIEIVPYLLAFAALFSLFDALNIMLSFALKGAGDTTFVSIAVLTIPWPLLVIPTWWTHQWPGAVYWGWSFICLYSFALASTFYWRFQQGKWKSMRVI